MQIDINKGSSYLDETVRAIKELDRQVLTEMAKIVSTLGVT